MRAAKRTSMILAAALLCALVVPSSAASSQDNQCWEYTKAERRFKKKVNAERVSDGLKKLRLDPELSKAARKHTKEMIQANKKNPDRGLFHTTSEQFHKRVTNWTIIGENVGYGGSVSSLHVAFMDSPPHAHNVLTATFTNVGVGARRDNNGRMWVTFIFQGTGNPGTTLRMPTC